MSTKLDFDITTLVGTENVSPYKAAKIVNSVLEKAGIDKQIPPQMMYNYTSARAKAGKPTLIKTVVENDKLFITPEGLTEWLTKYVVKNA